MLKDSNISDEYFILQVNNSVLTEDERARKLKSQSRANPTQESQIEEKTVDKSHNKILATIEALKAEIAGQ